MISLQKRPQKMRAATALKAKERSRATTQDILGLPFGVTSESGSQQRSLTKRQSWNNGSTALLRRCGAAAIQDARRSAQTSHES